MITSRMLALYCFLKEIGVCDRAQEVFWPDMGMDRSDLARVISFAGLEVPDYLLDTMWKWVDLKDLRPASEETLIELAYLYADNYLTDNTFLKRFQALLLTDDYILADLPF